MSSAVERAGEPGVHDPDRPALLLQLGSRRDATVDDGPEADDHDVRALAQDLAAADLDELRLDRVEVEAGVARVLQGERVLLGEGRAQQAP